MVLDGFVPWMARLVVLLFASMPTWVAARAFLAEGPGRSPWYVDAGRPLPAVQLLRLLGDLGPAAAGGLAASAVLAFLGQLFVTAGTVAVFDRDREASAARAFVRAGPRWLGAFLRVALLAVVLLAGGAWLLDLGLGALEDAVLPPDATAQAHVLTWPAGQAAAFLTWAWLVGAYALHVRVHLVLRRDRAVRRALLPALRFWLRHPLRGPLLYLAFALLGTALGAATLAAWRQSGGSPAWPALSLLALALQSAAWVAVVATATCAAHAAVRPARGLSSPA